ncbi:protein kinase [bacterium]|nr:protein kinase [bacterium]
MTAAPAADIEAARTLAKQLKQRWRQGAAPDAAAALADNPDLARNKSVVVDLAYEEFLLREQAGETPGLDSFADRFPAFRGSIRGALEAHRLLTERPDLLDPAAGPWPAAGEPFEGLDLLAELGRGAFGQAYLAFDPGTNRLCALKLTTGRSAEARVIGRLDHPHVTDVYWARAVGARTAVCMPFVGVSTLTDVISAAFPNPGDPAPALAGVILRAAESDDLTDRAVRRSAAVVAGGEPYAVGACAVAARVADAVAYLHREGVAHGDLKPSNVVIGPGGAPHLIDFNLSADEAAPPAARGTPAYMAPEMLDAALAGTPVTAAQTMRADLFSLGVLVYELLTGRLPFARDGNGGLAALAAAARAGRPEMPAGLPARAAATLSACLSADPARRPADAGAVTAALDRVVLAHRGRGRRGRRWAVGAGCGALLGLGATAAVVALGRNEAGVASTAEDYFTRGLASLEAGDLRSARADFEAAGARARNPKYPAYLAYTFALLDENVKSAEAAEKAIDDGGRTAEVLNNYGYALWWLDRQPDKAKAKARIAEALVLNPKLPAAKYNRALHALDAQLRAGRPGIDRLAVTDMRDVLAAGLRSPDLHHHAAQVFAVGRDGDPGLGADAFAQVEAAIRAGKSRDLVANDPILTTKLGRLPGFGRATTVPQGTPPPNPPKYRLVEPRF